MPVISIFKIYDLIMDFLINYVSYEQQSWLSVFHSFLKQELNCLQVTDFIGLSLHTLFFSFV